MKNSEDQEIKSSNNPENENDFLTLSLSYRPNKSRYSSSPSSPAELMPPTLPPQSMRPPHPLPSPPPSPLPPIIVQQKLSQQFPSHPKLSASIPTQPILMQTLLSQNPPQTPLQLAPTHPLLISPFVTEPPTSATQVVFNQATDPSHGSGAVQPSRPVRTRRNPTQGPREGKSDTVPVPFPWATNRRAMVHNLNYLLQKQIFIITGEVQCKRCERKFEMGFDLREKFDEVWNFIAEHKSTMHQRAPATWMNPVLPTCRHCAQQNSVKPIISKTMRSINWLFLLLGQMLGCCTLKQLKYFCKHTKNHRTGAKDRVLYLTYLALCKQLDPTGPFDR